ncbi:pyocin S6 family toxin immunity protein [Pseudomonas sp. Ant30-3]|uniref:pyocin S6 family toxin immunity protein n=1 Tax=Pseudomonas sp. Ant30-3 TaxID=1488328 RepID=UPI002E1FA00E
MGLKVRLNWYDKKTEIGVGKEYSADLGEDGSVIDALGLMAEPEIYDGGFDALPAWIPDLQPLFNHQIEPAAFDYQVAFRYRQVWRDLSITGFYPDEKQDDSLQFELTITSLALNQALAQLTESKSLEELEPGELELTAAQIARISEFLKVKLPQDLEYFIGPRASP